MLLNGIEFIIDFDMNGAINRSLSVPLPENAVFLRHFACFMFQPYVFSLVFALTSRNKGNWNIELLFSRKSSLSAVDSEIHLKHNPKVYA